MKRRKLVIFGAGDFAQLAKFYFENDSDYEVCGFVVDDDYHVSDSYLDLPLVLSERVQTVFPPEQYELYVAIAYTHLNEIRESKYDEYKKRGYHLASYISSKATCWNEGNEFGDNVFVLEDNTIQPYAHIGSNTILWSGNHIGHHAEVGNHVFITSHVVVSGRSVVGDNSFIGVNATINDHVRIGKRNIIGSGALITRDTDDDSMYKAKWTERNGDNVSNSKYFFKDSK
jgi:sugar O-acyltransferase (sialic acid O-acetyltransferase NeuD family)